MFRLTIVVLILLLPSATAGPVGVANAALCGNDPMIDGGAWERFCDIMPTVLILGPAALDTVETTCNGDDGNAVNRNHCRAMDGNPSQGPFGVCREGDALASTAATIDGALRATDEGICHEHWSTTRHAMATLLA